MELGRERVMSSNDETGGRLRLSSVTGGIFYEGQQHTPAPCVWREWRGENWSVRKVKVAGRARATMDVAAPVEDPSLRCSRGSSSREMVVVVQAVEVCSGVGESMGGRWRSGPEQRGR